jgi:VCBS repeat-containing protein
MDKKHPSHLHHSHHSQHHKHDWSWDHHHAKHGFLLLGTRGDDVLEGSNKSNAIFGLSGNDELIGNGGNDWLDGGRGNDLLDGGAGNDKVFGGKGDDTAVYSMAENIGAGACGFATRDLYDGGKGDDTLQLVLTKQESELTSVQDDIAKFEAFLLAHANPCGDRGPVFEFSSFDLAVRDFEELDVVIIGNDAPVAAADAWEVNEDGMLVVPANGVLANDADPDGKPQPLSAVNFTDPAHGMLSFGADGSFTYMPDKDYFGADSFTYQAYDGADTSAVTNVTLTVVEVNDAPVANQDSATVAEDDKNFSIDVLANDVAGPDNESDQALDVLSAHASHGSVNVLGNGTLHYTPDADYFGDDMIEYTIEDDGTTAGAADPLQAVGQVLVTVTEVNDAPVANDDQVSGIRNSDGGIHDGQIAIKVSDLLANDTPGLPENESTQTIEFVAERLPPITQYGHGELEYEASTQTIWYTPPDQLPADNIDRFGYVIQDDGTTNGLLDSMTDRAFAYIHIDEIVASSDADAILG